MIRNIIGFEGKYIISDCGDNDKTIFSIRKNDYLKPSVDQSNGRLKFNFNDSDRDYYLHRLVAETFIPNPNGYDEVHHLDGDFTNNRISNLQWIDSGEHRKLHSTQKSKTVYQYTKEGELFKIWGSVGECARSGYNKGHIAACCRGEQKTHKGFIWSYDSREQLHKDKAIQ